MKRKIIKEAVDIFDAYALPYQTKYMSVAKYHDSLDLFLNSLSNSNAEILELACGPGNITKYLLTQSPELNIIATDLSPSMLQLAQNNNPSANFQLMDCRSILELETTFDAILCGFGLPYVKKEEALKLIEDSARVLRMNGLLYLSTMEDDYHKSGFRGSSSNPDEGLFMYFHEADYLVKEIKKNEMEIVDLSRVKYPDNEGNEVVDLIIVAKKIKTD